jgi:hypothetical protein
MKSSICILIPVYRDWESVNKLITQIQDENKILSEIHFLIIDDFSLEYNEIRNTLILREDITIIELVTNLGHQKAISIGICYFADNFIGNYNYLVVMDGDGEDQPCDVFVLLEEIKRKDCDAVMAARGRRNESLLFRSMYKLYKFIYVLLTGYKLNFGNFCILDPRTVMRVIHMPDLWLHFSSTLKNSKMNIQFITLNRGKRFFGSSKMNFVSLIDHGLNSMSIYSARIAIRLMLFSFISICLTLITGFSILFIKNMLGVAIPGWTSNISMAIIIVLIQFFTLSVLISFIILANKTILKLIPKKVYKDYIYN